MSAPRVAVFSFADIDNYGDILFSWVVRNELRRRRPDVVVDFFTPSDCVVEGETYRGYARERVDGQYDLLMLAGGEVVHFFDERTWEPIYRKRGLSVLAGRASDVVWDWPSCQAPFKAWLSVGVRPFEDRADPARLTTVLDQLDFVSTRGILSKKILEGEDPFTVDDRIRITPDLGWLFPRLLADAEGDLSRRSQHVPGEKPYAVFQFHNITEEEGARIAWMLREFRRTTGLQILLVPVIHLWNDREPMQRIVDASEGEIRMPEKKLEPFEIARIATGADLVLCSSLHVAITAMAAGVPAGIFNKWPGTKFQDLLGLQMRSEHFVRTVDGIPAELERLVEEREDPSAIEAYSEFMVRSLDRVFDELASAL